MASNMLSLLRTTGSVLSKSNHKFLVLMQKQNVVRPMVCRFIQSSNKGGPKKGADMPPQDPQYGGSADIYANPGMIRRPIGPKTVEEFADPASQGNWISYGFDQVYMKEDRYLMHLSFFCLVTVCIVGSSFILYYYPDIKLDNWATREAYLEIHRRKKLGLPLVDKNYVDPAKIILPTEEELGGTEVII